MDYYDQRYIIYISYINTFTVFELKPQVGLAYHWKYIILHDLTILYIVVRSFNFILPLTILFCIIYGQDECQQTSHAYAPEAWWGGEHGGPYLFRFFPLTFINNYNLELF